jgi:hypothetical protein
LLGREVAVLMDGVRIAGEAVGSLQCGGTEGWDVFLCAQDWRYGGDEEDGGGGDSKCMLLNGNAKRPNLKADIRMKPTGINVLRTASDRIF